MADKHASVLRSIDFGNEAGDDVAAAELVSYFVEQAAFEKFRDHRHRLLVCHSRKGMGKSALLRWTAIKVQQADPDALVISVRGADLVRSRFNLSSQLTTPNEYAQDWMVRLCALINGSSLSSLTLH